MIKIITGSLKGRSIIGNEDFFSNHKVRPTSNYTKQVILNLINGNDALSKISIQDSIICDICCGSGSVGFEFLSNGAKKCYFIDQNINLLENVKKTASKLNLVDKIETLRSATKIKEIVDKIDIIFIDPPYPDEDRILTNFASIAKKSQCINDGTAIIFESSKSIKNKLLTMNCELLLERKISSKTHISIFFFNKTCFL